MNYVAMISSIVSGIGTICVNTTNAVFRGKVDVEDKKNEGTAHTDNSKIAIAAIVSISLIIISIIVVSARKK